MFSVLFRSLKALDSEIILISDVSFFIDADSPWPCVCRHLSDKKDQTSVTKVLIQKQKQQKQ